MNEIPEKIIFVYNADSGLVNGIKDYFKKIVSPSTYECNLCAVSFGNLGMRKEWKEYTTKSEIPMIFLHRDEFFKEFPKETNAKFPCAYGLKKNELFLLITQEEMDSLRNLEELIEITDSKIAIVA